MGPGRTERSAFAARLTRKSHSLPRRAKRAFPASTTEDEVGSESRGAAHTRPRPPVRPPSPPEATASAGARRRRPHSSSARSSRAMSFLPSVQRFRARRGRGLAQARRSDVTARARLSGVRPAPAGGRGLRGTRGTVVPGGGTSVTFCRVVKGDRPGAQPPQTLPSQLGLVLCIPNNGQMFASVREGLKARLPGRNSLWGLYKPPATRPDRWKSASSNQGRPKS